MELNTTSGLRPHPRSPIRLSILPRIFVHGLQSTQATHVIRECARALLAPFP